FSRDASKRVSWHERSLRKGASLYKGCNAFKVLGAPVHPITSKDDCWGMVHTAPVATPSLEGIDTAAFGTMPSRERRASISVAHLARNRALREEQRQEQMPVVQPMPASYFNFNLVEAPLLDPHPNGKSSDGYAQHAPGDSQPTTSSAESDGKYNTSLVLPEYQAVHEPINFDVPVSFQGYDAADHLTDGMARMLSFPGSETHGALAEDVTVLGIDFPNGGPLFEHEVFHELNNGFMSEHQLHRDDSETMTQYLNSDAFDPMMHL
ncbi:hypothetical protein EW145_g8535, partial [Phellinidium pouzarii]